MLIDDLEVARSGLRAPPIRQPKYVMVEHIETCQSQCPTHNLSFRPLKQLVYSPLFFFSPSENGSFPTGPGDPIRNVRKKREYVNEKVCAKKLDVALQGIAKYKTHL